MSRSLTTFPRGILVGATLMYFFDPRRGRQRRSRLVDLATHLARKERRLFDKAARDASHRAHGLVERVRREPSVAIDDEVVEARVRSELGRIVPHASAIEVASQLGRVTLRGPVLEQQAGELLRRVGRIGGVREVVDALDRHARADLPSLTGSAIPRGEQWPPSAQAAAIAGGGVMALWGLVRRGLVGSALTLGGGVLAARGALNLPLERMIAYLSARQGIEVTKTINVHAPIDRVFGLWSHFENFPRFMRHVHAVERDALDPMQSRWRVDGPAGVVLEFDIRVTRLEDRREVAWQTLPDQRIEHAGKVRFVATPDGTRIQITMTYRPPGGLLTHAIAHVLGWDPKARIDDDMIRMKALLEDGKTRAHGHRVDARDLLH